MGPRRPTQAQIRAAAGKTVPDVIAPDLKILFCGINPGLYTAAVGHHFARPGNRFWPTLHKAGFTNRLLAPHEEALLLQDGYGITNIVERATARADEITKEEFIAGAQKLVAKVRQYRPRTIAILGIGAYRSAFARPRATVGPQDLLLAGAELWVLPNPSGLNAHYQLDDLAAIFAQLRRAAEEG